MTLDHKSSHKQHRYICSNGQKYIVWVKVIDFSFMLNIIRILVKIMNRGDFFYISYRKYIET